jgi:hypothetical protein
VTSRARFLTALLSLAAASALAKDRVSRTGTWTCGSPQRGGGTLLVVDRGKSLDFQLELWRGAPSYNEGSLAGTVSLENDRGTFHTGEGEGACEIAFEFRGERAILTTVGSDAGCGFGYGVHAEGTYVQKSRKKPVFDRGD